MLDVGNVSHDDNVDGCQRGGGGSIRSISETSETLYNFSAKKELLLSTIQSVQIATLSNIVTHRNELGFDDASQSNLTLTRWQHYDTKSDWKLPRFGSVSIFWYIGIAIIVYRWDIGHWHWEIIYNDRKKKMRSIKNSLSITKNQPPQTWEAQIQIFKRTATSTADLRSWPDFPW